MMEDVGKEMSKIIQKRDINERYEELVNEVLKDQDVQAFIQANRERLSDEDIRKSYAKLYEFVQEKKKFQLNDPAMIAPGYEPRLMLNFHYIDVTYVPTADLIARQKEEDGSKSRKFASRTSFGMSIALTRLRISSSF